MSNFKPSAALAQLAEVIRLAALDLQEQTAVFADTGDLVVLRDAYGRFRAVDDAFAVLLQTEQKIDHAHQSEEQENRLEVIEDQMALLNATLLQRAK